MSEENKAIARKFFRMFESGDPGMAGEFVAADYYNHDAPNPNIGLEGVKAGVTGFKNALSDARITIPKTTPSRSSPNMDARFMQALATKFEQQNLPKKPRSSPWRNFKHGKALYQPSNPPKK